MADNTNDLSISLGLDPTGLRSGLTEAERLVESSSQRIRSSIERIGNLGQQLAGLGATMTASLTLPIVGLATASVRAYGDLQALKMGLTAVMGSAERASGEFEKLIEVAKLPGLGLQGAVRGSVSLQAAGFSAEKARKSLLSFGNALATVGKGENELNMVVLALTQLNNKSSGFGQDLRQLTEQLPQLRGALLDAFGTIDTEEIGKMGVTGAQVVEKLTKEFEKLPKVSGGINNAFENLKDKVFVNLSKIGEIIDKTFNISDIVDKITGYLDKIVSAFESLDPSIQKTILVVAGLVAGLGPLLLAVGGFMTLLPVLTAGVMALGSAFLAILSPIGLVTVAIIGIVSAVVANWDKIRPYLVDTLDKFKRLYKESTILRAGITVLGASIEGFARSSVVVLGIFYKNFVDFGKAVLNIFKGIGDGIEGTLTFNTDKIKKGFIGVMGAPLTYITDLTNNSLDGLKEIKKISDDAVKKWSNLDVSKWEVPKKLGSEIEKEVNKGVTKGLEGLKGVNKKEIKTTVEEIQPIKVKSAGFMDNLGNEFKTYVDLMQSETARLNSILNVALPKVLSDSEKAFLENKIFMEDWTADLNKELEGLIGSSISDAISDTFASIGKAVAEGGNVIGAIGSSLLNAFSGFLSSMGKLLIKYGTLAVVKGTLDEIVKTGGYQAIAAGIAAIAVGAALSLAGGALGTKANGGMNGNISSSSGVSNSTGFSSSNYSGGGSSGGEYVFRLSGADLVATFNRNVSAEDRVNAG